MECGGGRRGAAEAGAVPGGVWGRRSAAWASTGVAGAKEEDHSGDLVRAAQLTKSLGRRSRSKRGERGSQGSGFSPFLRFGTGHPPSWISASLPEVVAACGELLCCWGDPGASLGV